MTLDISTASILKDCGGFEWASNKAYATRE